jgi:O-antigen/teichoic acid export membrane protein
MDKKFLFKSFSLITIANFITKPIWFFLFVFAARVLGTEQFGVYTYITSIILIFSVLIDSGLDYYLIRECTQSDLNYAKLVNSINTLRLGFSCIILIIIFSLHYVDVFSLFEVICLALVLCFQTLTLLISSIKSLVASSNDFVSYSKMLVAEKLIIMVFGFMALLIDNKLISFLISMSVANLIVLLIFYTKNKKKYQLGFKIPYFSELSYIVKKTKFLILLNIFIAIYFRVDILILQYFVSKNSILGLYGSIHRIIEMYLLFPTIIMSVAYPIIAKNLSTKQNEVSILSEKLLKFFFSFSLLIAVVCSFNSYSVNLLLFGQAYKGGENGLKIIIWTILPLGLNYVLGNLLVTINKEKYSALSIAIACVFSIAGNVILAPIFNFVGTSIILLFTESIIFFLYSYFIHKHFKIINIIGLIKRFLLIVIITFIVISLIASLLNLNLILNMLWQVILVVLILKYMGFLDVKLLFSLIKDTRNKIAY